MCRVTPDTLTWFALLVPDELAVALPPEAVGDEEEDEQAAARRARLAAAATASARRERLTPVPDEPAGQREARSVRCIIVLPY